MAWLEDTYTNNKTGLRRYRRRSRERMQKIRYGVGMWAGLMAVHFTKKLIRAIPVVGTLANPILNLFPSVVVGPAIGAAVVFVLDEGDIPTATEKLKSKLHKARGEVESVARDLHDDLQHVVKRHEDQTGQPLLPAALNEHIKTIETTITPVVDREKRRVQSQLEWLRREQAYQAQLQQAAAGRS